jgi:nitrogen regulatory protein PII
MEASKRKKSIRKRIEIVAEAALRRRLVAALDTARVTGYTIIAVVGGRGDEGEWNRGGQVTSAREKIMIISITDAERAEVALDVVLKELSDGSGIVSISDVAVVREEKF